MPPKKFVGREQAAGIGWRQENGAAKIQCADKLLGIVDMTPEISGAKPRKDAPLIMLFILVACGSATLALLYVCYVLRMFYIDTAALAPRSEIRPMGVTLHLGLTCTASLCLGSMCALTGAVFAVKERQWHLAILAVLAGGLSLTPMFVSDWGFNHVLALRQLILAQ